jgi:hypothetical protein
MYYYNFLLNKYKNRGSGIRFAGLKGSKNTVFAIRGTFINVHLLKRLVRQMQA